MDENLKSFVDEAEIYTDLRCPMDSLSQIVLGSAVAEATLGKKIGNKAILWGAIAGTIPDLDVISNWWLDEFTAMSLHRGFSHSLVFCLLMSPLFGWLVNKLYQKKKEADFRGWTLLFFWCFVTHIALDCLTSWGTQIFWPFPARVSTNSIFVADPLYTVPFLILVITVMFFKRTNPRRAKINRLGLILSTSYLAFGLVVKTWVNSAFQESFVNQGHEVVKFESRPAPLNLLLWTANVETEEEYLLGYYSIFDKDTDVDYVHIPKRHDLIEPYLDDPVVQKVLFMTQGWYSLRQTDSCLVVNDLRFGQPKGWESEPDEFVFRYHLMPEGDSFRVDVSDPPRPTNDAERAEMSELLGKIFRRALGEKNPQ